MKIYTKTGDGGSTSLMHGVRVSKSDDRIELLGTMDELSSHLGLAKVAAEEAVKEKLSQLQRELMGIMAGVANPRERKYKVTTEQIIALEQEIDCVENSFHRERQFVLYGGCELSARLDVARAVARRAERCFKRVALRYGADVGAMKYMNRLADYLYILARFVDDQTEQKAQEEQKITDIDAEIESVVKAVLKNLNK